MRNNFVPLLRLYYITLTSQNIDFATFSTDNDAINANEKMTGWRFCGQKYSSSNQSEISIKIPPKATAIKILWNAESTGSEYISIYAMANGNTLPTFRNRFGMQKGSQFLENYASGKAVQTVDVSSYCNMQGYCVSTHAPTGPCWRSFAGYVVGRGTALVSGSVLSESTGNNIDEIRLYTPAKLVEGSSMAVWVRTK